MRRPPTKFSLNPSLNDGDGNHIHNKILLDLPPKEREMLFPKLEFVRLKTHHLLHEPGDTLKSAYFCDSGLISILSVFSDGKTVEVGGQGGVCRHTAGCGFSHRRFSGGAADRCYGLPRGWRNPDGNSPRVPPIGAAVIGNSHE